MFNFYLIPYFWALCLTFIIQLLVYLLLFRRLAMYREPKSFALAWRPVSVIIAARDEARNLTKFLPAIMEQDYTEFEVIVVDDQSEDGTRELLEEMQLLYPRLRVVAITEHVNEFAGKKLALTLGIKAAQNEILLLTDADSVPVSDQWIRKMAEAYQDADTEIVLGFSPYKVKPSLINLFIQFDTFYTALQYFSFTLAGMPYMGVGRNLSYKRSLFFKSKGFAPFLKVSSGDDDLFVNHNATANNVAIQLDENSFVLSIPKKSWSDWISQKRRHLRTGKFYKGKHKLWLGLIWIFNILFYASVVLGVIFIKPFWISLAVYGLRMVVQIIMMYLSLRKLKMSRIWWATPLLDAVYQLIYMPVMGLLGLLTKKRRAW
jgi:glycosyltransferase involved in cell wall biosynthesis